MQITTVLFDLDGTLLPMNQKRFVMTYLEHLAAYLVPHGYDPGIVSRAIWAGTEAMMKNDGSARNDEVFWKAFESFCGEGARKDEPVFRKFYETRFQNVAKVCGYNPKAVKTVNAVKAKGFRVALATNPLFPPIATENRIRWAGLEPEDFEIYTNYENCRFCKPNLDYYREILKKLGVKAEECLMVGNDAGEDMITEKLGMKTFLLTDYVIDRGLDITRWKQGGFQELLDYIDTL
ncbi:MAG: HAD family hydrolase [Oscillospiraceae bacterium]|nr:HAD family hydrolase [Oscillospiraceae bacterium]